MTTSISDTMKGIEPIILSTNSQHHQKTLLSNKISHTSVLWRGWSARHLSYFPSSLWWAWLNSSSRARVLVCCRQNLPLRFFTRWDDAGSSTVPCFFWRNPSLTILCVTAASSDRSCSASPSRSSHCCESRISGFWASTQTDMVITIHSSEDRKNKPTLNDVLSRSHRTRSRANSAWA